MRKFCLILFIFGFVFISSVSAATYRTPENPEASVNGIDYYYYHVSADYMPDFDNLAVYKSGQALNFDLSKRVKDSRFAFKFTGYIEVPTDNTYTFYLSSDDGSQLYIGDQLVVDHDGIHDASEEMSGSIALGEGKHALTVLFFENSGTQSLTVSYESSEIAKQAIPNSALFRATNGSGSVSSYREPDTPKKVINGLSYYDYYYNGDSLPDFDDLTTLKFGYINSFNINNATRSSKYAMKFNGYIKVEEQGAYNFYTTSDDGSQLFIGDQLVVDNDGLHGAEQQSGIIGLQPGYHEITVDYFEKKGQNSLEVQYDGPNITKKIIPDAVLYRDYSTGLEAPCEGDATEVEGLANGYYKVTYDSGCIAEFQSHYRTSSKKTQPVFINDNKQVVVLGPFYKRIKITSASNGQIKDVVRISKKDRKKGNLQVIDLRGDGKYEAVVVNKLKKVVRVSVVKIKIKKKIFAKKITRKFNGKLIRPSKTEYDSDSNLILIKNKKDKIKKQYRVTKKYNLKRVK